MELLLLSLALLFLTLVPADLALSESADPVQSARSLDPADLFSLRLLAPSDGFPGQIYSARLKVESPYDHSAVVGAQVKAVFRIGEETLRVETQTDQRGEALLQLPLSKTHGDDFGELVATVRYRGLERSLETEFWITSTERFLFHTDKKLYRPGQTLHMRALWLDETYGAQADKELTFEIFDGKDRPVFQSRVVTSPFGVAHEEWPIPPAAPGGNYSVKVSYEGTVQRRHTVRIGSYELPALRIVARPSREFFLPGQPVELQVEVESLIGEPVAGAGIEVHLRSDWRGGKRDTTSALATGIADSAGQLTLPLDLTDSWRPLLIPPALRWTARDQYRDLILEAVGIHPLSGRRESTQVRLRLSRNPIHLYLIQESQATAPELPTERFLVASYADGRPARCTVIVSRKTRSREKSNAGLVAQLSTNRLGVGRLLLNPETREVLAASGNLTLHVAAWDSAGRLGEIDALLQGSKTEIITLRVKADKRLHRAGEPLQVIVQSSQPIERIALEVHSQGIVLESKQISVSNEAKKVTFAYRDTMTGILDVVAYSLDPRPGEDSWDLPADSERVIYLGSTGFAVKAEGQHTSYRPGEQAQLEIAVRDEDRIGASVLGIVVVDQSVRQREASTPGLRGKAGLALSEREEYSWPEIAGYTPLRLLSLDPRREIPQELEVLAEALLTDQDRPQLEVEESSPFGEEKKTFKQYFSRQFEPIDEILRTAYRRPLWSAPRDEASTTYLLAQQGIDLAELKDPWGVAYRSQVRRDGFRNHLVFLSAGWDRRWKTADDFTAWSWSWRWFSPLGEAIENAVRRAFAERGKLLRDEAELTTELARAGIVWERLRDPWDRPYRMTWQVRGHHFHLRIESSGPDGMWHEENRPSRDDITVWNIRIDYSLALRRQLEPLLAQYSAEHGDLPKDQAELNALLRSAALEIQEWRDPWGQPLYFRFQQQERFVDRALTHLVLLNEKNGVQYYEPQSEPLPVTERANLLLVMSHGPDGTADTRLDQTVALFSRPLANTELRRAPQGDDEAALVSQESGALIGRMVTKDGSPLPGVTVSAVHSATGARSLTLASASGVFAFSLLPPGAYTVTAELEGFSTVEFTSLTVETERITTVKIELIAAVQEMITVRGQLPPLVEMKISTGTSVAGVLTSTATRSAPETTRHLSTPRLRQDFPETLLWIPELLTDANGKAHIDLPLADNVTTWQVEVLASTRDGRVAATQAEVVAVQPLYVEPDPPSSLTVGDRLRLPVLLHNLTDETAKVALSASTEGGLSLAAAVRSSMQLEPGAQLLPIDLLALAAGASSIKVEAAGREDGDAVQRPILIRAFGRPTTSSVGRLLSGESALEIEVPAEALAGSVRLEVRRYPDLEAHLLASTAALQARPTGCAEQTVSKGYLSLLLLRLTRGGAMTPEELEPDGLARAEHYVIEATGALPAFRASGGGFAYWEGEDADLALTAYVVDFLAQAGEFATVDQGNLRQAIHWLLAQQTDEGGWVSYRAWDRSAQVEASPDLALSAEIARVLASVASSGQLQGEQIAKTTAAVDRALSYLDPRLHATSRPYALAAYTLAALARDDPKRAEKAARKLASMAQRQGSGLFWHQPTNTPFYGWGRAGRLETTALAVEALVAIQGTNAPTVEEGLTFLLENKAADGGWDSTQATVRVLQALAQTLGPGEGGSSNSAKTAEARLLLDGRPLSESGVSSLLFAANDSLSPGRHRLELIGVNAETRELLQATVHYAMPWDSPLPAADQSGQEALRFSVDCAPRQPRVGQTVTCKVEAERVGFRGYGMMIAEIGLPPGAEVDRGALDAVTDAGLNHWEVLPDRVITYLWPRAGGSKFAISFRPRLEMEAKSYPSSLYDYYNPQARVVLPPASYSVVGDSGDKADLSRTQSGGPR